MGIMEDKMFELMEKMYSEFTKRFDGIDQRMDGIDKKLDEKADKEDIVVMGNTLLPKHKQHLRGIRQCMKSFRNMIKNLMNYLIRLTIVAAIHELPQYHEM